MLPDELVQQDDMMMAAADQAGQPVRLARDVWTAPDEGALETAVRATPLRPPNQFSPELTPAEAYAACGPAAAITFAMATGRYPTLREAVDLARTVGWTPEQGMAGPASEVALLGKMGVASHLEQGVDWAKIKREVASGNPVIIDSAAHYFVATAYDPKNDKFFVGASGTAIKGGSEWLGPGDFAGVGGGRLNTTPRATLFLDSPHAPLPSPAAGSSPLGNAYVAAPSGPNTATQSGDLSGLQWNAADDYLINSSEALQDWIKDQPNRLKQMYEMSNTLWEHSSADVLRQAEAIAAAPQSREAPMWERIDSGQEIPPGSPEASQTSPQPRSAPESPAGAL